MRVLLIHDFKALAQALAHALMCREENFALECVAWQAFDDQRSWADYYAVLIAFDSLNAALLEQQEAINTLLSKITEQCCAAAIPLLFLSDAVVFDGARIAYHETDQPNPVTELGQAYVDWEKIVLAAPKTLVLRSAWLYGSTENNFVTQAIAYAKAHRCIAINSAAKANPTSNDDLARVITAILLQLTFPLDNFGIYHYVAADTALGFQFLEAVLNQAQKYDDAIDAKQVCFEHHTVQNNFYFPPVILKCQRLLDDFGIHQRAWRSEMPKVVRAIFSS